MKKINSFCPGRWRYAGLIGLFFGGVIGAHAAFEENARGARGIAMGDAYGAVADTADGLYWNPAALARVPSQQILGTHADLFTGIQGVDLMTDAVSYAYPTLEQGVWGVSWNSLNSKSLYGEDTVTLGYGRKVPIPVSFLKKADVSFGANLKYLRTRYTLDDATSQDPVFSDGLKTSAVTGDIGTLVRVGPVATGLSFRNVTEPDFGLKESERVPLETRVSGAYTGDVLFFDNATVALELILVRDSTHLSAGWESHFFDDQAAFRLGANPDELTVGLGWLHALTRSPVTMGFDYAYVLPLSLAANQAVTHRFSFNVGFGR